MNVEKAFHETSLKTISMFQRQNPTRTSRASAASVAPYIKWDSIRPAACLSYKTETLESDDGYSNLFAYRFDVLILEGGRIFNWL